MRALSLRARLTLWYSVALVVVLCFFGADLAWVQGRLGVRRIDRELTGEIATLATILRVMPRCGNRRSNRKTRLGPTSSINRGLR